jgi:putative transcriptional regulator
VYGSKYKKDTHNWERLLFESCTLWCPSIKVPEMRLVKALMHMAKVGFDYTPQNASLEGQILLSMPAMRDDRFARSVIYICAHSAEGAMGLVLNKPVEDMSFLDLIDKLDLSQGEPILINKHDAARMPVFHGGPVEMERGFVLHSNDFNLGPSTLSIKNGICLTATLDILRAIASGHGPHSSLTALGYSGWGPGQLENEIKSNGWLVAPTDPQLIFSRDIEHKYHHGLSLLGIQEHQLSHEIGNA